MVHEHILAQLCTTALNIRLFPYNIMGVMYDIGVKGKRLYNGYT